MHPKLKAFIEVAPFLLDALLVDAALGVTDTEKFIYYAPGKTIDVKVKIGDPLAADAISQALRENRSVQQFVPAEVFGVPFMATGAPIRDDDGKIIGAYGYAMDVTARVELERRVKTMSEELASSIQQMSASVQEVGANSEKLAAYFVEIVAKANNARNLLKNIDEILKFVQGVGNKTNLIGLNAAIEAARAGEAGRSFKIVANEIRDLAVRSKQSVEEITTYLQDIHQEVEDMATAIHENESSIHQQSAAMEEFSASMEEISAMADQLQEVAEHLVES